MPFFEAEGLRIAYDDLGEASPLFEEASPLFEIGF